MKYIFSCFVLFLSLNAAAEDKCKKRDLTADELAKINTCLMYTSSLLKNNDVHLYSDLSGKFYGVKTGKSNIVVYTENGSLEADGKRLSCNTNRSSNFEKLITSIAASEYAQQTPSKGLDTAQKSSFLVSLRECRKIIPYYSCVNDELQNNLNDLMLRYQKIQKDRYTPQETQPIDNTSTR